ncbi:MAG TPA: hypothetical protein VFN37_00635 [Candidatus Baltobacteraceae bacterium]|nr:hypothetical protein [Candidatus Baltobacteraceae bacterium]
MNPHTFQFDLVFGAVAALSALVLAVLGVRTGRRSTTALALFAVAAVSLAVAVLVVLRAASPIIGYTMLCLALASFQLFGLLQDERARRRRVASLVPRPAAQAVPAIWVAIAAASVLMLAPYALHGQERAAALVVGICALVMSGIAWRIASAPVQLYGEDIRAERLRDRAWRSRKAGVSAVIAVGCIYAFMSFANSGVPAVMPWQRLLLHVSLVVWAALGVSVVLYSRYLDHLSRAAS